MTLLSYARKRLSVITNNSSSLSEHSDQSTQTSVSAASSPTLPNSKPALPRVSTSSRMNTGKAIIHSFSDNHIQYSGGTTSGNRSSSVAPEAPAAHPPLRMRSSESKQDMKADYQRDYKRMSLTSRHASLPSQHIRESRRFSLPLNGTINLNHQLIQNNIPQQLIPIINLINAYQIKTFITTRCDVAVDGVLNWTTVNLKLFGNEIYFYNYNFKSFYINLIDAKVELAIDSHMLRVRNSGKCIEIRVNDREEFLSLVSSLNLSRFEYISLNEAYTAVILSVKGSKLYDIKTLLSNNQHKKVEWCNIRIPQISSKWMKLEMHITPASSKKKNGNVKFYLPSKSPFGSKKLICYIENVSHCFNMFPEISNNKVININSMIKVTGTVKIHKNYIHLFSAQSNISNKRKKSNSKLKYLSFEKMYILPLEHPGVKQIETMIRCYLPMINAFKLYGKPAKLISDRSNSKSLLFGMPILPNINYMSNEDSRDITSMYINEAISKGWDDDDWRNIYKNHLSKRISGDSGDYEGCGNLYEFYYNFEIEDSGDDGDYDIEDKFIDFNYYNEDAVDNSNGFHLGELNESNGSSEGNREDLMDIDEDSEEEQQTQQQERNSSVHHVVKRHVSIKSLKEKKHETLSYQLTDNPYYSAHDLLDGALQQQLGDQSYIQQQSQQRQPLNNTEPQIERKNQPFGYDFEKPIDIDEDEDFISVKSNPAYINMNDMNEKATENLFLGHNLEVDPIKT